MPPSNRPDWTVENGLTTTLAGEGQRVSQAFKIKR